MNVIRTHGFVGVLVVGGVYLTMPVVLFDIGDDVVVLDSENIPRAMAAAEEMSELRPDTDLDDLAAWRAFIDAYDRFTEIESRGHPGHRLRLQTLTARRYQQPCFIRSISDGTIRPETFFTALTSTCCGCGSRFSALAWLTSFS